MSPARTATPTSTSHTEARPTRASRASSPVHGATARHHSLPKHMLGLSLLYPHLRGMAWAGRLEVWPGQPRAASGRGRGPPRSGVLPRAPGPEWFRPQFSPPLSHAGRLPWAERHLLRCALRAGHALRRPHHGHRLPAPHGAARPRYVYHRRRLGDPRPFQAGVRHRVSSASKIGFDVFDANQPTTTVVAQRKGVWQTWKEDGILAFYKHQTFFVRANGWEARVAPAPPLALPNTPPLYPRLSTPDYQPAPLVAPRLAIAALCAHWPSRAQPQCTPSCSYCTLSDPTPCHALTHTGKSDPRADLQRGARRVVVAL